MFQLSQTHNQAFQVKVEADFVCEVMQYLRENHAETIVKLPNDEFKVADLSQKTLQKMVEGGIANARNYAMTSRSTLISFVVVMFVSAPNFDKHTKVKEVFKASILPPNMRIDLLWKKTSDEDWEDIKKNYNTNHWNIREGN